MINDIENKREWMNSTYVSSRRHTLQVSSARLFREIFHYLRFFLVIEFKQYFVLWKNANALSYVSFRRFG